MRIYSDICRCSVLMVFACPCVQEHMERLPQCLTAPLLPVHLLLTLEPPPNILAPLHSTLKEAKATKPLLQAHVGAAMP